MSSQIVTYELDESTVVQFEIDPTAEFRPASSDKVVSRISDAVVPVVEAANAVLDKIKETRPDGIELRFGIKVSGGANWIVAHAAAEGNFEVTLIWKRTDRNRVDPARAENES